MGRKGKSTPKSVNKSNKAKVKTYTTNSCQLCDELDKDEMVSCDLCSKWYHFTCVNIVSIGKDEDWVCQACKDEIINKSSIQQPSASTSEPTVSVTQLSSSDNQVVITTSSQLSIFSPLHSSHSVISKTDNHGRDLLAAKSTVSISSTPKQIKFQQPTNEQSERIISTNSQSFNDNYAFNMRYVQSYSYPRMTPSVNNFLTTVGPGSNQRQQYLPMIRRENTSKGYIPKYNLFRNFSMQPNRMVQPNQFESNVCVQNQQMNATFNMSRRNAQRIRDVNLSDASIYSNPQSSDQFSVMSTIKSTISSRRKLIELAKIEEERELQEKRDHEYLRRKYSILLENCESSEKSAHTDRSKFTEDWINVNHETKCGVHKISDENSNPNINQENVFQTKLDKIQFDTTSPMKSADFGGNHQRNQYRSCWDNPKLSNPNQSLRNLNNFRSYEEQPTNSQVRVAESEDQCTLTKAQIAARHVVTKDLPIFYGKPEDWPMFICRYNNSTKTCGFSNQENLDRLQKCLKGKAYTAVQSRLLSVESVPGIIETLRMLYGRPELIMNSLLENIRQEPAPKADKLNTLVDFALKVGNISSVMVEIGLESHLTNPIMIKEVEDKLPPNIKIEWARYKQMQATINLETIGRWLLQLAETISVVTEPVFSKSSEKKWENKFENKSKKESNNNNIHLDNQVNVHQEPSEKKDEIIQCLICQNKCQKVEECSVFLSYDVDRRWKELYNNKLCRKCLQRHGKLCSQNKNCGMDGCVYKHHALLHDAKKHKNQITPTKAVSTQVKSSINTHNTFYRKVLSRIVPVAIHAGNRSISSFAYMDDGSDLTIVNQSLIDRLGIRGTSEPLCLLWTGDMHRNENNSQRVTFNISGTDQSRLYCMRDVRTVEALGLKRQTLIKSEIVERFQYLNDVPIVDYRDAIPEILIGSDNVSLIAQLEIVEGEFNQPIASKTRLGWSIYGNLSNRSNNTAEANVNPHNSICPYNMIDYDDIHQQVKDFFTLENFGIQRNYTLNSKEDERALELLKKHTKRIGSQFETGLLWRYDSVDLPDSYAMAFKRLQCLEKHKPGLVKVINETIEDYERKGYISKLNDEIIKIKSKVWYLPIFAVFHPKKPDRIRTVFDAAAIVKGVSLNSMLLKGPDQLASLVDILRRFREKKFVIAGDIKEMFHQVKVRDEDKQAQRFLWRNGDQNKTPDHYVMNVMTFGAKCSPSAAQFVKNLNATEFEQKYPRAVEGIVKNHYVDDWLDGEDDEEKLAKLVNEVIEIHAHGGFEIRNFLSNSIDIKKRFGEQKIEGKNLNLEINHGTERVLGMWWDTRNDKFTFSLKYFKIDNDIINQTRSPTKREVLKILMSVFDPLGFLSHYLIHLKILLQQVWRSHLDWDEELNTDDMRIAWKNWFELLHKVEEIKIPRLLSTKMSPNISKSVEIHVFVDASEQAFSTVIFMRVEDEDGVDVSLIGSKARVAL